MVATVQVTAELNLTPKVSRPNSAQLLLITIRLPV
jgi:hypothetical protein